MKYHEAWSYSPYTPLFFNSGDIYICRVAPGVDHITFDWLHNSGGDDYFVFYRKRNEDEFISAGCTRGNSFTICGLIENTEYEFYVQAGGKKSRIRLARCGAAFGSIVNYLHREDEAYSFSGKYLCSPSLVRHPGGYLLASMDVYAGAYPQNLTLIFRSDDEGVTWHYVSELFPCFWGKMFIYGGELYMLGCSTEYGDLLIGKSSDGGRTFTQPTVLFKGGNGKNGEPGVHKNPQPVVMHGGRIWNTLEWGAWGREYHAAMVMSAETGADLLAPKIWTFSQPVKYNPEWEGVPRGRSSGNIEGSLVEMHGGLYNIMRYDMRQLERKHGLVVSYRVNTQNPGAPLEYDRCIEFPGNHSKFMIKYDDRTKQYYSIISRILDDGSAHYRNLLSLIKSSDALNWELDRDIMDCRDCDPKKIGFQYVDFLIEGGRILYLCRTSMNDAANFHDSNYSIFGTITI